MHWDAWHHGTWSFAITLDRRNVYLCAFGWTFGFFTRH